MAANSTVRIFQIGLNQYSVRLFDTVQATWNVLETSAGSALQTAHDSGMGVIVKEALANGRLTFRNNDPQFLSKRLTLDRLAERHCTSIDALALAMVLYQPWIDVVLSGAVKKEHLASNLKSLDIALDPDTLEELAGLTESPDAYWLARSLLEWN